MTELSGNKASILKHTSQYDQWEETEVQLTEQTSTSKIMYTITYYALYLYYILYSTIVPNQVDRSAR